MDSEDELTPEQLLEEARVLIDALNFSDPRRHGLESAIGCIEEVLAHPRSSEQEKMVAKNLLSTACRQWLEYAGTLLEHPNPASHTIAELIGAGADLLKGGSAFHFLPADQQQAMDVKRILIPLVRKLIGCVSEWEINQFLRSRERKPNRE